MTFHAFTLTVATLCAAAAITVFGAARGLGYEAPGADDVTLVEPSDTPANILAVAEGACEGSGRTWVRGPEVHQCWPVERLSPGPVVARRPITRKVAEREPEELVGSKTHRPGSLGAQPGRAGAVLRRAP